MTPTEMREALESRGELLAADEPGTYAILVDVPNTVDAVQEEWLRIFDGPLLDEMAEQLAGAERVVYVGATGRPIRERLSEHLEARVRRASFLRVFSPSAIEGVWAGSHSGVTERNRSRELANETTVCWCDGELF